MSLFEKIIIPLIDENLSIEDVSTKSGFIDSYTVDLDHPSWEKVVYLAYDDSLRTDDTKKCARKLESLAVLKNTYVKVCDRKPIMIYKLYAKADLKNLFNGEIELTPKQMKRIFDFWGYDSDVAFYICSNKRKVLGVDHNMPLEDYVPRFG